MIKKWMLSLVVLIFLSGCSNINGKSEFTEKIHSIEQALHAPKWQQLKSLGDDLDQLYQKNQWKIQLMGDEGEYENLEESIHHLVVAIEEQDITEIKLELATVKTLLKDIYSL